MFLRPSIVWILLTLLFAPPMLSELTQADLEAIRAIVKEEIKESEKRTDLKFDAVNARIDEMDKRLTSEIRGVDKRFSDMRAILIALIAFIVLLSQR